MKNKLSHKSTSRIISISVIASYAFVILGLIGYVKGIVKLVNCDFKESYKAEILYGVGTFTGLNAVFGWIDFGK